jgi:hypothetical protein
MPVPGSRTAPRRQGGAYGPAGKGPFAEKQKSPARRSCPLSQAAFIQPKPTNSMFRRMVHEGPAGALFMKRSSISY